MLQSADESYIHLHPLRAIWDNPVTARPRMEPNFAAACHGLELAFILLAEFIQDPRQYLAKRPRVELLCRDVEAQCQLLAQLMDGELEDTRIFPAGDPPGREDIYPDADAGAAPPLVADGSADSDSDADGGRTDSDEPPTILRAAGAGPAAGAVSPGLDLLHAAVAAALAGASADTRRSLTATVRALVNAFRSHTGLWAVGLGPEPQLNRLCAAVGLPPLLAERARCLDYALLVRPQAAADTLLREEYAHAEDFFFRTVHLGTECWAFVAGARLRSAAACARARDWRQATVQARCAARIFEYLGDHVLMVPHPPTHPPAPPADDDAAGLLCPASR
jgi:hypothetical protein